MLMIKRNILLSVIFRKNLVRIAIFFSLIIPELVISQDIKVTTKLDTNSILIGQQTTLTMSVIASNKLNFDYSLLTDSIPKTIEILDIKTDTTVENNYKSIEYHFNITSFDSGYHAIPPLKIVYHIANDTNIKYSESDPLLLEVKTIPVDLNGEIKDLKNIMEEPITLEEFLRRYYLPLIGVLAILAFIILIIIRLQRNKKKAQQPEVFLLPPDIEAIEALTKLKEEKLWQNDRVKDYYSKISDILRRYIERRFDIPAQEMVTSEIVGCAISSGMAKEHTDKIEQQFKIADLVKFAKYTPIITENEDIINWAFEFIEQTKTAERNEEENQ